MEPITRNWSKHDLMPLLPDMTNFMTKLTGARYIKQRPNRPAPRRLRKMPDRNREDTYMSGKNVCECEIIPAQS